MTTSVAFDPGALLRLEVARSIADNGQEQLVEAILHRHDDGRLELKLIDDDGEAIGSVTLRADFLSTVLAAGAREAAA